jgi:hypothetical protein
MAHHYLWGSKALNIANSTIYGQERILFPCQQFDIVFLLAAAAAPPNILNYSLFRAQSQRCGTGTVGTVTFGLVEPEREP